MPRSTLLFLLVLLHSVPANGSVLSFLARGAGKCCPCVRRATSPGAAPTEKSEQNRRADKKYVWSTSLASTDVGGDGAECSSTDGEESTDDRDDVDKLPRTVIIFMRHGSREDHEHAENGRGEQWVENSPRPWDTPLSAMGKKQARAAGKAIAEFIQGYDLPPLKRVYSSPALRCVETAAGAVQGFNEELLEKRGEASPAGFEMDKGIFLEPRTENSSSSLQHIFIEPGLAEPFVPDWYNSWAIVGADGSWGSKKSRASLRAHMQGTKWDKTPVNENAGRPVSELLLRPAELNAALTSSEEQVLGEATHPAFEYEHFDQFSASHPETMEQHSARALQVAKHHAGLLDGEGGGTVVFVTHSPTCTDGVFQLLGQEGVARWLRGFW